LNDILRFPVPVTVRLAAGLVAGVAVVQQFPALPGLWIFAILCPLLAVCIRFRRPLFIAFAFGLIWALGYASLRLSDQLPAATERRQALIEGTVLAIPQPIERGVRFDFGVSRTLEPTAEHIPKRLRLSWYDAAAAPKAGEIWRFRVSLRRPHGMLNPGGFDYEQWLFAQGIRAVGYVRNSADNRRLASGAEQVLSPRVWRQAVYDGLSATLAGSPVAGLIKALTMGADDDITPEQWEVLRRTGTAHLIAISGSHIGLIAAFAFFLTQWICTRLGMLRWPPPRIAAMAGFIAALLYSALADFAIPTQRAIIMIGIAMGAVILQRPLNAPHVLATAMLAVVLYDPLAVLSPGFWLSFGAVALIAFALSARTATPRGWRALLKINWATAFGLTPFLLLFFGQVSLMSPVANLLAVPVLGTVLIPVCLAGALLLPIFPAAGAWLLNLAEHLLGWTWMALEWLSAWPWAQWTRAEPPFWTIPPALLGALLLLAPRGIPARWLGLVLLVPALASRTEHPARGDFRLVLLDVGQGLAAVVETRHRILIFDTGAKLGPRFDMGGAVIEPYLRRRGIGSIDTLVVSHGDNDHIGGARSLLKLFPIATTYTSVPEKLAGFPTVSCREDQRWAWDGVEFEMLGPVANSVKENDNSCVLRVQGRHGSALLTGDIERAAEGLLAGRYGGRLKSDILVVPHHGSNTSSTRGFLDAVSPRYALIPAGYLNRFGFPHPAVVKRYEEINATMLNTAEAGAIGVTVGDGLRPERYRSEHRRYWHE
jgi:competence protein ComEC